jgi:hypothetical protein
VIEYDCIDSNASNYHTIMTTTAPMAKEVCDCCLMPNEKPICALTP